MPRSSCASSTSTGLFFGLSLASLIVPWRMWRNRRAHHALVARAAALLAFVLTGLPEREIADPSRLTVFVAAALAICASRFWASRAISVAPRSASTRRRWRRSPRATSAISRPSPPGRSLASALFARTLVKLLRDHRDVTVAVLLGLMVGSLRALWPWTAADGALLAPPSESSAVVPLALMALCGIAAVLTLQSLQGRREGPAAPSCRAS